MSSEIFSIVLSILLGAAIASVGFILRSHLDHRARLNEALFALLELYRVTLVTTGIDVKASIRIVYEELEKQLPGEGGDVVASIYAPEIRKMMDAIFRMNWKRFEDGVGTHLTELCTKVASVDPLLAVRLQGGALMVQGMPAVRAYHEAAQSLVASPEDPAIIASVDRAEEAINGHTHKMYVEKLQSDVLALACACGPVTAFRTYLKLRRHRKQSVQLAFETTLREWVRGATAAERRARRVLSHVPADDHASAPSPSA